MSEFKPKDHMLDIQGKDYLPVAPRVLWARGDHPDWGISTDVVWIGETAYMRATVADCDGRVLATGHKMVNPNRRGPGAQYPVESAETGAIGRALALCGYGTLAGDLDEGEEIADTPVERKGKPKAEPKPDTLHDGGAFTAEQVDKWHSSPPVEPVTGSEAHEEHASIKLACLAAIEARDKTQIPALRKRVGKLAAGFHREGAERWLALTTVILDGGSIPDAKLDIVKAKIFAMPDDTEHRDTAIGILAARETS